MTWHRINIAAVACAAIVTALLESERVVRADDPTRRAAPDYVDASRYGRAVGIPGYRVYRPRYSVPGLPAHGSTRPRGYSSTYDRWRDYGVPAPRRDFIPGINYGVRSPQREFLPGINYGVRSPYPTYGIDRR